MIKHLIPMMVMIGLMAGLHAEEEWRTWTSSAGTKIEARLASSNGGGSVTLEKRGGGSLTIQLSQLSHGDQAYVESLGKVEAPKGSTTIEGVAAELKKNPKARLGLDAEDEADKFAGKHFFRGDNKPDAARESAAAKLEQKFPDQPFAERFERMGQPSVEP